MKSFELTKEAKKDLRKIAEYTEKRWGRPQRNLYTKQFDDGFYLLAETPSVGKKCDYIKVGYRKFPQGSHIIFFFIEKLRKAKLQLFVSFIKTWMLNQSLYTHNVLLTGYRVDQALAYRIHRPV